MCNKNDLDTYRKSNVKSIGKKIVMVLLLLIIYYSIYSDELLSVVSNFGIKEFYMQEFNEAFLYTRLYDIDKDNDDEIITLSEKNKALSINIYDWKNNKLERINSFILENEETFMKDWEIGNLDEDGMFEVVVSLKQGNKTDIRKKSEIRIYKKINDKFDMIESLDYKRDIEIIKDKDGRKQLICYHNGKIVSYSFINKKLVKNYNGKISTTGLGITKADFDGDDIDELYFVKDKGNGTKKSKCILIKIEQSGNGTVESQAGEIDLNSETLYFTEPRNFVIYDMNEDGKDDFIFQTRSRLARGPWLNVLSLKDSKWIKIYSGGYLKYIEKHDIWELVFLGKGDINGDGVEEIIMTGDASRNYYNEREGEPVNSKLFFYKIEPNKFRINTFFQKFN